MAIVPWVTDMHKITLPHYWTEHVNGVTVFRILIKEVRDPDTAVAVFRGVSAMARRMVPAFILLDLSQTKHMSGMAFVVLSSLAQQVAATRGRLAICRLDATLRVGAELMGLSSGVDIYDDEAFALASFSDGVRPHHPDPAGVQGAAISPGRRLGGGEILRGH